MPTPAGRTRRSSSRSTPRTSRRATCSASSRATPARPTSSSRAASIAPAWTGLPWHRRALDARAAVLHGLHDAAVAGAPRALRRRAASRRSSACCKLFAGVGSVAAAGRSTLPLPLPIWQDGTLFLCTGFVLLNLLIMLEVADRLSLKHDLNVARDIQLAMLPQGTYRRARPRGARRDAAGEHGRRRLLRHAPARRRPADRRARRRRRQGQPGGAADGAAARDAAHAGRRGARARPAARAAERAGAAARAALALRHAVSRRARARRPACSLGQRRPEPAAHPPRRRPGRARSHATGVALGMFEGSTYDGQRADGSNPATCSSPTATASPKPRTTAGEPFDEAGLDAVLARVVERHRPGDHAARSSRAVTAHVGDARFARRPHGPRPAPAVSPPVAARPASAPRRRRFGRQPGHRRAERPARDNA